MTAPFFWIINKTTGDVTGTATQANTIKIVDSSSTAQKKLVFIDDSVENDYATITIDNENRLHMCK